MDDRSGLKIEAEIYQKMLNRLRDKYKEKFGENAFSDDVVALSREDYIEIYSKNLNFWKDNLPNLDNMSRVPPSAILATHAICTNAISALQKKMDQAGMST